MTHARLPAADPRTIARDIPGVLDALFPLLNSGVVAFYNRTATRSASVTRVPQLLIESSRLNRAMLFELAFAAGEQLIAGAPSIEWPKALRAAGGRQRRHFDAAIPDTLSAADIEAATAVAKNLVTLTREIGQKYSAPVLPTPTVPGYEWIASSFGDFSVDCQLIEVKCSSRHFGAPDYRQLMMYWLLSFAASIQSNGLEWRRAILLNPRLNLLVDVSFDELLYVISSGRTKLDLLNIFASMVGTRHRS